jgi:release factor glutamine methyltransferase
VNVVLRATAIRDALDGAATAIGAAGSDTPRLDAELLLAHVLGVSRSALVIDGGEPIPQEAIRPFQDLVRRRAVEREPVAYIVGRRGFRHIEVAVDQRALVPRPETELLVDVAAALPRAARVVDVGTGSGAVALALKSERPDLAVTATDSSADALALAAENAARLRLDVDLVECDLLPPGARFDAVVSNPPYVADSERASLAPEIVRHEPARALFAGPDGLDVIRRLVPAAAASGAALLAIEIGQGQAGDVLTLVRDAGFTDARAERDLAGIKRVVVGRREG